MAGKQVQRRRGSTAQHAVFTGALGEITVDTDKKTAEQAARDWINANESVWKAWLPAAQ